MCVCERERERLRRRKRQRRVLFLIKETYTDLQCLCVGLGACMCAYACVYTCVSETWRRRQLLLLKTNAWIYSSVCARMCVCVRPRQETQGVLGEGEWGFVCLLVA